MREHDVKVELESVDIRASRCGAVKGLHKNEAKSFYERKIDKENDKDGNSPHETEGVSQGEGEISEEV